MDRQELTVSTLGQCRHQSPLRFDSPSHPRSRMFVDDEHRLLSEIIVDSTRPSESPATFELAGPRERIYFEPGRVKAAIVTCGGLSPGLNNVIRSVFYELHENYGVPTVLGIRNGYLGLNPASGREPVEMTEEFVEPIDKLGGTILGTSRGPQDPVVMADFLEHHGINMLFCLGGDGTQRGALALSNELHRRKSETAVIGIPKTIDNDVPFVSLSFGYTTALEKAAEVIRGAHVEARGAVNGIALVKLMGRHAGFIAAGASVVSQEVDFVLVPEIPFPVDGPDGFLAALDRRMDRRTHAVIVVAEGAGQHLFKDKPRERDRSGNLKNHDIGDHMRELIVGHFADRDIPISLKYLDPSYHIRSVPANVYDRYLCDQMGRHAVHAAMSGRTGMLIGFEHRRYIHVPISAVVSRDRHIDLTGDLWRAVLEATTQPRW